MEKKELIRHELADRKKMKLNKRNKMMKEKT
jgi:hypothetical protein